MRNDCTVGKLSERNEAGDEEAIHRHNQSCMSGVGVAQPWLELYVRSWSWKWTVPLQEYKSKGDGCTTKFFPRYDGSYIIINAHPETSNYTLELPNLPNVFPTFHSSELKPYLKNNPILFPSREMAEPQPVVTNQGLEEYLVNEIIDSCRRGRGYQYLVQWTGYGPEHN